MSRLWRHGTSSFNAGFRSSSSSRLWSVSGLVWASSHRQEYGAKCPRLPACTPKTGKQGILLHIYLSYRAFRNREIFRLSGKRSNVANASESDRDLILLSLVCSKSIQPPVVHAHLSHHPITPSHNSRILPATNHIIPTWFDVVGRCWCLLTPLTSVFCGLLPTWKQSVIHPPATDPIPALSSHLSPRGKYLPSIKHVFRVPTFRLLHIHSTWWNALRPCP